MRRRLKIERLKRRMKQEDVAEYLGIGRVYYGQVERGMYDSRPKVWAKLEELFGVPKELLMDNSGENDGVLKAARIKREREYV